ncbi:hypothetical protein P7C71_g6622, partial [Lecanoromycetidae sp. Uapishka_2]
ILNLQNNEGEDDDEDYTLCFAACNDLRGFIATINGIPEGHPASFTCVLNCLEPNWARSLLLLLVALVFPPDTGAEIMLHMGHSAFLTAEMAALVRKKIRPLIAFGVEAGRECGDDELVTRVFTFGTSAIRICLEKQKWVYVLLLLDLDPAQFDQSREGNRLGYIAARLAYDETDSLHRHFFNISPSKRVSTKRFMREEILLPFGAPLDDFNEPNFTFCEPLSKRWLFTRAPDPLT